MLAALVSTTATKCVSPPFFFRVFGVSFHPPGFLLRLLSCAPSTLYSTWVFFFFLVSFLWFWVSLSSFLLLSPLLEPSLLFFFFVVCQVPAGGRSCNTTQKKKRQAHQIIINLWALIAFSGTIQFGYIEEADAGGKLVVVDAPAGSTVHIPQVRKLGSVQDSLLVFGLLWQAAFCELHNGAWSKHTQVFTALMPIMHGKLDAFFHLQGLIHFNHNLECATATFIANFGRSENLESWLWCWRVLVEFIVRGQVACSSSKASQLPLFQWKGNDTQSAASCSHVTHCLSSQEVLHFQTAACAAVCTHGTQCFCWLHCQTATSAAVCTLGTQCNQQVPVYRQKRQKSVSTVSCTKEGFANPSCI